MNKKQLKVIWVGIVFIVLMAFFPPWAQVTSGGASFSRGYGLIFIPPGNLLHLDIPRLLVQWAIVGMIVTGLLLTLSSKR